MQTDTRYLTLAEGSTSVSRGELRNKHVLGVWREGFEYDILRGVIPSPGTRQVDYIGFIGAFRFDAPGNPGGEKILIWYEV